MIHATRAFVLNEWIQTKIEGYEVYGTVEYAGWWSPIIIRGDDREAVHIPNHKFTMSVNIVEDICKVLAKNTQVEHKRLHRRVFLDNVNAENQALLIMVTYFVKTSYFEEYLCVKEAILMDLLRFAIHHRARLATPIRILQKCIRMRTWTPSHSETIFTRASPSIDDRPYLIVEPSFKFNGNETPKARPLRIGAPEEEEEVIAAETTMSISNVDIKADSNVDDKMISMPSDSKVGRNLTDKSTSSIADLKPSGFYLKTSICMPPLTLAVSSYWVSSTSLVLTKFLQGRKG